MSRLSDFPARFFLTATATRAYAETLVLFLALLLVTTAIYGSEARVMFINSLLFLIDPCCGLYYALRCRVPGGRWLRRNWLDALWLLAPTLLFNGLVWALVRATQGEGFGFNDNSLGLDLLFMVSLAFPYVFFRCAVRFIAWWNRLRQRRLIWSLVTSHLLAVALLQALVVLPVTVGLAFSNLGGSAVERVPATPLSQFLYRLQMALPLVGIAILGATVVLFAVLPVSIVVSYFFARRIRRRLDTLLDAAHAARDGNYDALVLVSGHDEIAHLQTDFNAMTANLKLNVNELRAEREKVAALLDTRRELMASVSHELRTPIATVRAYLESALRQQGDSGDMTIARSDLAIIQRETLRLQGLIDDLFALSRAEVDQLALKCVPMDAAALIARVVETVAPLAWRVNRVEVITDTPAWLPPVLADESRLEQALRNLIHNSLRHTPPGGLVVISAAVAEGRARIQVRDTGAGIQTDDLPHVWERYYRDAENGGTGIGLALVKSFIEAMNGQVAVESTPGEGACFTLSLPIAPPAATSSPSLPLPRPVARTPAKTRIPLP